MQNLTVVLNVFGFGVCVLVAWILFSEEDLLYLVLVYLGVCVYGVFLAYDVRQSWKINIYD